MNIQILTSAIIVLLIFLGFMIMLSIRSQKYNQTYESTVTAGRSSSLFLIAASAVGAQIGSGFVLGSAEHGANYGIGGAWYGICCGLSFVVAGLFLGRIFRNMDCISISEYLRSRYQNNTTSILYSVSNIFSGFSLIAGQLLAGKTLFASLGLNETAGIVTVTLVIFLFVTFSGMWGVLAASALQSIVIVVGMIVVLWQVIGQEGVHILKVALPESYFSIQPYDWETFVQLTIPTILFAQISQFLFQRFAAADSERSAVRGHVIGGVVLIPLAFVPTLIGMFGKVLFSQAHYEGIFVKILIDRMPALISGGVIAAILCAVISSCNATFLMINTCFVHDICNGLFPNRVSEKRTRRLSVYSNIITCLIGTVLALTNSSILNLMSLAYTFMISGCLVPFLGGILWKRPGAKAAISSSVVGILTALLYSFKVIRFPFGSIFPIVPSLAFYVLIGLVEKPFAASRDTAE